MSGAPQPGAETDSLYEVYAIKDAEADGLPPGKVEIGTDLHESPFAMAGRSCDVAIIGAGTAGLAAERSARHAGASTLLIDEEFSGTTCATVGCMPSKLLIAAADAAEAVRRAPVFGVHGGQPAIDGAAVLRRVRRERDRFVAAVKVSYGHLPAGVMVSARARLTSTTTLALDDGTTVTAKAIVIATGAKPHVPEIFAAVKSCVLTNDTLFNLADLPGSVAVIGAGPVGLELAQALARLNVKTALFDQGRRFAGLQDQAVAADLKAILERDFPIRLGVQVEARPDDNGAMLSWKGDSTGTQCFERLLVAAGRPPQLGWLGLGSVGIPLDDHGVPRFDKSTLQCEGVPVFIAGDADADRPMLHEASSEGAIAGRNAACFPNVRPGRRTVPFSLLFTDPPLAIIGEATDETEALIGRASYEDQGRAKVMARNAGLVHIYATRTEGRLIGAAMAGPGVEHSAHLIAWAIECGKTACELLEMPFYHPTLEEGLKPALHEICRYVCSRATR